MKLLIVLLAVVGVSMGGESRAKRGYLGGSVPSVLSVPSVVGVPSVVSVPKVVSVPSVVSVPKVVSVASSPYVALHSYPYAQPAVHYSGYPSLAYAAPAYAAPWW